MNSLGKIVILSLFFTACGKKEVTSNKLNIFAQTYSNDAISLKKQFLSCQTSEFKTLMKDLSFPSFQNAEVTTSTQNFSPLLQGIFLRDQKVISETLYGEETDWLAADKGFYVEKIKTPKNVFVCPEEVNYERESIEAAALNTSYFIKKTNLKFTSLAPEIDVTPITLNIAPLITQSYLYKGGDGNTYKDSSYMTDNAFYMPAHKSVTFLPHSKFLKAFQLKMNYWEVPMVASHEYGHHLFQMIYKYEYLNTLHDHHGCFGPVQKKKAKTATKRFDARKVKIDDVVNAYNEGFADLVSFYTLDPLERGVRNVKCLEVSRDVESAVFYNEKQKIFSKEAVRSFFSPYDESASEVCEDISYQSIHAFGAVMAYSMNTFLSGLTNSDDEKLLAVVEWVKFLRTERKKLLLAKPENYFKLTMDEFIRMSAKRFEADFDKELCQKIDTIFPLNDITECSVKKDL